MPDPVREGEQQDQRDGAGLATSEAPADTTKTQDANQAAPSKTRAASGDPAPSAGKADPPAPEGGKAPATTKTASPAKAAPQKDPKHEAKLAFLAGETPGSEPQPKDPKAKPGEKPASGAAAPASSEKPGEPSKEPGADDIPADRKKASEAFATLRRDLKQAKDERTALEPDAEMGRAFHGILATHQVEADFNVVRDEEVAGVIKIQAALNRAHVALANGEKPIASDVQVIQAAIASLEPVAKDLGLKRAAAPLQVQAYTGDLPEDLQQLVDAQWLPEARVRRMLALELAAKEAEKSAAAPPAQPPASTAAERKAPATLTRRDAPRQNGGQSADELVYIGKSKGYLADRGVTAEAQAEHYKTKLVPIIVHDLLAKRLPQGVDAVKAWMALSPQAKHDHLVEAQQLLEKRAAPATSPQAPNPSERPAPKTDSPRQVLFQRNFARGPGRNRSQQTPADAKGRLAFMAGEASQE